MFVSSEYVLYAYLHSKGSCVIPVGMVRKRMHA